MAALEGKTAIVTGASSGIGAATARALAVAGTKVVGGARRVGELETDVALELDVTDPASCERFVAEAVEALGGLDILVNDAGLGLGRDPFDKSSEEDEETVLETNVHGVLRMTRLCLPHIRDGGHIVDMGSIAGRQPYENAAVYITSKYACAAPPTRCERTCSAGRSTSRPSSPASSRRTSRGCASAVTRRRRAPSTRTSSRSRPTTWPSA